MKKMMIVSMFMLIYSFVYASEQKHILYEGYLTDSSGLPANKSIKISFSLFDAQTDGNKIWGAQVFDPVPVTDGYFTVELGGFASVDFSKNLWLEIEIDAKKLEGRQKLSSVPHAINSVISETVSSLENQKTAIETWAKGVCFDIKTELAGVLDDAYAAKQHNHDSIYALFVHDHDSVYSNLNHNHDSSYSMLTHNHDSLYAPKVHNHNDLYFTESEVTGFLSGKADSVHNHGIAEIVGLQYSLNNKASTEHNHDDSYAVSNHNHDTEYAPLTGSIDYIWNQSSAPQAGGFNISGNGLIGGNLLMGTETPSARLNVTGALPFSGTGSLSSSDTTVTGTGTMFTNELHVGDVLIVGDKKRIIGAIVSDTELITLTAFDPILTDSIYQYQQPVASFATQSGNSALFVSAEGNVGIKTAIPTKELEVSGTIKAAGFIGDGIIPKGLISMWSGSIAGIPSGWALCDGTNGTPDLRDRFIVGAGSNYSVGVTGGEATHTLNIAEMPSHGHTASSNSTGDHTHNIDPPNTGTSTNGNHSHTQKETRIDVGAEKIWPSCFPEDGGACVWRHYVDLASYNGNHSHTIDIGSFNSGNNGNHSHTITVNNTGGGQAHENRPPYYALAYIMKL